ncbi:MAG: aminotransferase class V-fold PLP-dependent enzyme, partial [Halioglobus sp.]|nr:aminotransferase class V-fold PLP-dependent enzyme [Halioglobus sp.]
MASYRADFPALAQSVNNHPLVYLDSAASSQQPAVSIDAMSEYQRHSHANVHRGVHTLSHRATDIYEGARDAVKSFIN